MRPVLLTSSQVSPSTAAAQQATTEIQMVVQLAATIRGKISRANAKSNSMAAPARLPDAPFDEPSQAGDWVANDKVGDQQSGIDADGIEFELRNFLGAIRHVGQQDERDERRSLHQLNELVDEARQHWPK